MSAPLTPLNLAPANDATVTTSNFMASATLRPWPNRTKLQFQFATDVGFSTDVHTAETDFRNPGSAAVFAGTPRLPQGAVWVRVRAIEEGTGDPSAWSASHELNVTHPGNSYLVSPGRGQALPWDGGEVTFDWEFRDTCDLDAQTAYRLRVETDDSDSTYAIIAAVYESYGSIVSVNDDYDDLANSGGSASLYDSGKITSTVETLDVTLPIGAKNELVRWSVQTWDTDDETAGVTEHLPFFVGDLPVVTITAPVTDITTPTPTVTWTYTSAAGHAQQQFEVQFYNATTGALLFTSGPQAGAGTSYTPPPGTLANGLSVIVTVIVTSSIGMQESASETVATDWIAPPNPSFTIDPQFYAEYGRVDLSWADAPEDPTFVEWRVYRRNDSDADWVYLGATEDAEWIDHEAPPLPDVQYSVTQVGVAYDVQVESSLYPISTDLSVTTYMLKVLDDPGRVIVLRNVTSDEFAHQYEANVMDIIGAGRKAEIGTTLGRAGSLSVQLRDMGIEGGAGEAYRTLLDIKNSKVACLLRVPFRETIVVHLGDIGVTRIAGVVTELSDVTIPYTEIV